MDELEKERKTFESAGRLHWFHWAVVVASMVLTFSAWHVSRTSIDDKVALQFDRYARQTVELVIERMQKYEDGLWGGVAAIQALGGSVSYNDWLTFSTSLRLDQKYPGINGIGVIHYVSPDHLPSYLAEQRRSRPDFKVHPAHDRAEYWPITYIEPVSGNRKAVGLDMAHETNRYLAAVRARDSGKAQITGPITLVQDEQKKPGFLFYAPYYQGGVYDSLEQRRATFSGMVYAPFVFQKLMEGTLHQKNRQVGIKILDEGTVLYDEHHPDMVDYDPSPLFSKRFEVDMYGRSWIFDIRSALSFRESSISNQPLLILLGGIIIDALLLTLFILLAHANRRAYRYIRKITGD